MRAPDGPQPDARDRRGPSLAMGRRPLPALYNRGDRSGSLVGAGRPVPGRREPMTTPTFPALRELLRAGFAAFVLGCVALATAIGCAREERPSVVLITIDTLRADAVGFSGNERARTPYLDALAEAGVVFERATTPIPRTTPGVASLLSGLTPARHGSREVGHPMREVEGLAAILARHGYTTLGVSGNPAAARFQGIHRGFDHFLGPAKLGGEERPGWVGKPGWATTHGALELVDEIGPDQPFFLWALYFDPHFPYQRQAARRGTAETSECRALYREIEDGLKLGLVYTDHEGRASRAVEDCRRLYRAAVQTADREVGRLLDGLRERRPELRPIVVVTADHGENFGEEGLYYEHGENVHEAALAVPLAFVGPGIAAGRRVGEPASLTDVAPTLLHLLGLGDEASQMDGRDLSPRITPAGGPAARDVHALYFESASPLWNQAFHRVATGSVGRRACVNGPRFTLCRGRDRSAPPRLYEPAVDPLLREDLAADHPEAVAELLEAWERWPPGSARQRAVLRGPFKLVATPRYEGGYDLALFDVVADPEQLDDLSAERPDLVEALAQDLRRWAASLPEEGEGFVDPRVERALRSLGYVE